MQILWTCTTREILLRFNKIYAFDGDLFDRLMIHKSIIYLYHYLHVIEPSQTTNSLYMTCKYPNCFARNDKTHFKVWSLIKRDLMNTIFVDQHVLKAAIFLPFLSFICAFLYNVDREYVYSQRPEIVMLWHHLSVQYFTKLTDCDSIVVQDVSSSSMQHKKRVC